MGKATGFPVPADVLGSLAHDATFKIPAAANFHTRPCSSINRPEELKSRFVAPGPPLTHALLPSLYRLYSWKTATFLERSARVLHSLLAFLSKL